VVKLPEKTILFDTGGDGGILLDNMKKLGISPSEIDAVVLSHIHGDHTGGLKGFLKQNSQVTVYLPRSFPTQMKQDIRACGAEVKDLHEPEELFEGVFTTGELDGGIKEQSLLVETSEGLVVITGCAHPGIVNITKKAKEITGNNIYLVMGGFHLGGAFTSQISYIAESLLQLGVRKVAPCHCSGDEARKLFKDYFGENYIDSGVGKEITIK
jgi:7,8-dihydropterin-6-yl-methyl-4-(beta-D-ribofuranosyl)aminobenzene 5'-phosphate synthase